MRDLVSAVLMVIVASGAALGAQPPEPGARSSPSDGSRDNFTVSDHGPTMRRAIARARASLPQFLELAAHPPPGTEDFAIKYGVQTDDGVEYVWASLISQIGDRVLATVDVDVQWSKDLVAGDPVFVDQSEIIDWMYVDQGRMIGNATLCALDFTSPTRRMRAIRERMRMDCAWLREPNP